MEQPSILEEYARTGSPEAYRQLVERYGGIVYAAARRQMRDSHLAEDVAQAVFIVLSQKAKTIPLDRPLSAWLLKTTRYAAANARRLRQHQLHIESRAAQMRADVTSPAEHQANDLAPLLDDGISRLRRRDRDALLLRFFEQKPLEEVGRVLGISERAAQKRVSRAVERLRDFFQRRGADVSVGALTTLILASAAEAAPSGLSAILISAAAPAAKANLAGAVAKGVMATMAAKKLAAGVAVLVALLLMVGTVAVLLPDSPAPDSGPADSPVVTVVDSPGTTAPTSPWLTTSQTGGLVELIGVASFPADNGIWWKPDGSPQVNPIPQLLGPQPILRARPSGGRGYTLFVRSSFNGRQAVVYPHAPPPAYTEYHRRVAADALIQEVILVVPEGTREATFGLGLDLLQLGRKRIFDVSGHPLLEEHIHNFGNTGRLKVSGIRDIDGTAQATAEFSAGTNGSFFKNHRISFVAYGENGQTISARQLKLEHLPDGGVNVQFAIQSPAAQVARLTGLLTPHEYAEFQEISLEFGNLSTVKVVPLGPADPVSSPKRSSTSPAITETAP